MEKSIPTIATDAEGPQPLIVLGEKDSPLAIARASWSPEALLIEVDVTDEKHAPGAGGRIWEGDSIELAIDAMGDGTRGEPDSMSGPMGPDDFKFIFALGPEGAEARTLAGETRYPAEELLANSAITREGDQTKYRIALPWKLLHATPGASPAIGLDLKVNDRSSEEEDKRETAWGRGFEQSFSAGRLPRVALAPPDDERIALHWLDTTAWDAKDQNLLAAGIRSAEPTQIRLEWRDQSETVELPGGKGWQHFQLRVPQATDAGTLIASPSSGSPAVATQTAVTELVEKLEDRLTELLSTEDLNPLFRRHLQSLQSLVLTDWARTRLLLDADPQRARESIGYYRTILDGLTGESSEWEAFLDGRRSLVMAYTSPHDQTVQYYFLGLPDNWNPEKEYPLFFELHGSGNDHPLAKIAAKSAVEETAEGAGYVVPKTYAEIDRSGYWVHPFGRGNLRYRGIALIDILEAYDDAHDLVKIDPDRRYLYGFSMGGGGTFHFGMATPSRWAAANALAPGGRANISNDGLVSNWKMVPLRMVCGTEDFLYPKFGRYLSKLKANGITPVVQEVPGLGHRYLKKLQEEKIAWLKKHVREKPQEFTFSTRDPLTNTCWGITLDVAEAAPEPASVTVRREGETLHLDTSGTEGVKLELTGPDTLDIDGDIRVLLNGKEVYSGEAKPLKFKVDA